MNKDEFRDNAKAPGKKGNPAKSSAGNAQQVRPPSPGLHPEPRPPFAGPMHVAVNIRPLPSVVKPAQEKDTDKAGRDKK